MIVDSAKTDTVHLVCRLLTVGCLLYGLSAHPKSTMLQTYQEKPQKQSQRPIDEEGEGENIENIEGTESKLILLPPQRVGVKNTKNLKKKYFLSN